jgi:serine/threonine protein phosphatase PrpC
VQAYNLSIDHKPNLEIEKERILKAGGFIQYGRVNGSLNLARAIGTHIFLILIPILNEKSDYFYLLCLFLV